MRRSAAKPPPPVYIAAILHQCVPTTTKAWIASVTPWKINPMPEEADNPRRRVDPARADAAQDRVGIGEEQIGDDHRGQDGNDDRGQRRKLRQRMPNMSTSAF
jgi:hypothetical protein